jgi:hypothetical protein
LTPASGPPLDLVVLVADADQRTVFRSLLAQRAESLAVRLLRFEILQHPQRDPGCVHRAAGLLQPYAGEPTRALVVFDHQGSGQERRDPAELAREVRGRLSERGWKDRVEVLAIAPELETWLWSDSPRVEEVLGWHGRKPSLRDWLAQSGLWPLDVLKPPSPKECLEKILRLTSLPRSAALYGKLAPAVGLAKCADPSFLRLEEILRAWFPRSEDV